MEATQNNPEGTQKSQGSSSADGDAENTVSAGDAAALAKKVQELEAQLKEKESKYVYLYADFENFKKRAIKERSDLIKYGWENAARELLQVIDNLERALEHMPPTTDKTLSQGLHMVINQFKATLQKQGVEPIDSLKKSFDPNLHEAISQEQSPDPEGTIVKEHLKGYTIHGRLLRPSRVSVSNGKAAG